MYAKFIKQPVSGQYEEKTFDFCTTWKNPIWCWVKFTCNNGNEWVGTFRGKPLNTAIAKKINQVAILTSECLYILNIDKKEVLFYEQQTELREITEIPTKDKFVVASYYQIGTLDKNFNTEFLDLEYDIDNVEFGEYEGNKLNISFQKISNYNVVSGLLDTENWEIKLK